MARVTIERSLDKVDSRYELVVLTAYRAHSIAYGSEQLVDANDKFDVIALREIENGKIDIDELRNAVIKMYALENKTSLSKNSFVVNDFVFENESDHSNNVDIKKTIDSKIVNLSVGSDFFQ